MSWIKAHYKETADDLVLELEADPGQKLSVFDQRVIRALEQSPSDFFWYILRTYLPEDAAYYPLQRMCQFLFEKLLFLVYQDEDYDERKWDVKEGNEFVEKIPDSLKTLADRFPEERISKKDFFLLSHDLLSVIWDLDMAYYGTPFSAARKKGLTFFSFQLRATLKPAAEEAPYPFMFALTFNDNSSDLDHIHTRSLSQIPAFADNPAILYHLMDPLTDIARKDDLIRSLLQTRALFEPVYLSRQEALYLADHTLPLMQSSGIITHFPAWANKTPSQLLLDNYDYQQDGISATIINRFIPRMVYQGVEISKEEAKELLNQEEGLYLIQNQWIRIDHAELKKLLKEFQEAEKRPAGLIRSLNKIARKKEEDSEIEVRFAHSDWLERALGLNVEVKDIPALEAGYDKIMRPYQKDGYKWLRTMTSRHLGVCLADDMGLGKTLQVLSLLSSMKKEGKNKVLIIVPATLVANWKNEIRKFAPDLDFCTISGKDVPENGTVGAFISLITYQMARKTPYLDTVLWDAIILDEAQAIKNATTAQTKRIKQISGDMKIALTGTPVENRAGELWSIFDFLNPGLLGSEEEFKEFWKRTHRRKDSDHAELKKIISPFILRRMKTDKSIISDLPKKNMIDVSIDPTREQVILYKKEVDHMNSLLNHEVSEADRFTVLSTIMRLKQICNHPDQYSHETAYATSRSGKFIQLREIAQTIAESQEKVLVFTQFKAIIPALDHLLYSVFRKKGGTIDGSVSLKKREQLVDEFQNGELPYLVLSLKTAGVGLNLTAAQNVIHFDRWWNPAVENQATDRAYRIGQDHEVNVYRFSTADTIEEVINRMLFQKQALADDLINGLDDDVVSKLSTEQLIAAIQGEF